MPDFSDFLEIQTQTPWGRTLVDFARFCQPPSGWVTLDVGCGPGLLAGIFEGAGCTAFGLDVDIALLKSGLSPRLVAGDALALPFPPASFDLISAVNLLFLLSDPASALLEMKRLLKPGGMICLLNPSEHLSLESAARLADARGLAGKARTSLLNWATNAESHCRWSEAETRRLLAGAGLEQVEACLRVGPGFARYVRAARPPVHLASGG